MDKVTFYPLTEWAILPEKEKVNLSSENFSEIRWFHKKRKKGACWPYKFAKELGWIICSPIDVIIEPVEEVQVSVESTTDLEEIQHLRGIDFWVKRDDIYIGLKPDGWFRIHQSIIDGVWHSMFVPNGEGSFEWKLGWNVEIPKDFVLLFQPLEGISEFITHPGLLTSKMLPSFHSGLGLPIAFEPRKKKQILRGEPLGKMYVFHKSALSLKEEVIMEERIYEPNEI
ncbi:TPA: hypothetical protein ROY10_004222 [Bacillus thuringiensis]|nr:hypothetical protein [Bacillus thuringiensis]